MALLKEWHLEGIFHELYTDVHDKEEVVKEAIERHHLDKDVTVIVGDTPHEIEAGQAVGIKTIAVTWGFKDEDSLLEHNPDFIARTSQELQNILLSQ